MESRASAKEIPVSDAPIMTTLAFLTILASLKSFLDVKQRANGDSVSSSAFLSAPSTGTLKSLSGSSSAEVEEDLFSHRSWSHFLSRKCGKRLLRTWINSWKIVGITVFDWTSKYRHVLPLSLSTSLRKNRVDFSKIGLIVEKIRRVCPLRSCSVKRI